MRGKSHREVYPAMTPPPGGRLQPIPSAKGKDLFDTPQGARVRALVRRAGLSPDKTVHAERNGDRDAATRALKSGLLAPLGDDELYRITAKGEAWLRQLARVE